MPSSTHINKDQKYLKGGERKEMMNKKGLSNVVAVVLIVLLGLAAIAIIWTFIQPIITGGGANIDFTQKCINTAVKVNSCSIVPSSSTHIVTLNYQLERGDNPEKVIFVMEADSATSNFVTIPYDAPTSILETKSQQITMNTGGDFGTYADGIILEDADSYAAQGPIKVKVTPAFARDNGNIEPCDLPDQAVACTFVP